MAPSTSARAPQLAIVYLLAAWACLRAFWYWQGTAGAHVNLVTPEALFKLLVWSAVAIAAVTLLNPAVRPFPLTALGFNSSVWQGLAFGVIAALPMLAAAAYLPKKPLDIDLIIGSSLIGPVAEEALFRGFLFRQLQRHVGWPVWLAILVSSAAFGLAHIRNIDFDLWRALSGPDPMAFDLRSSGHVVVYYRSGFDLWWTECARLATRLELCASYAFGGAIFAWVAYRLNSLWPAIALHVVMNFCWDISRGEHSLPIFSAEPLAMAQGLTIIAALTLVEVYARRTSALTPAVS